VKGITHTRTINFDKMQNSFDLADMIEGTNAGYLVNMPLHLHPDVAAVQISANKYLLKHTKTTSTIEVSFDNLFSVKKIEAEKEKKIGWYSAAFMEKEKSSLLMGECKSKQKQISLRTTIKINHSN
jgi:hypothetical protein